MSTPARKLPTGAPPTIALHDRAMDNLRYIRETMERSGSFTHVSGMGGVLMGIVAILAAAATWTETNSARWLAEWLAAAVVSLSLSVWCMGRKSRAQGVPLLSGPGRKFAWNVIPPLAAGAVLTLVLAQAGMHDRLPGMWLLLYGTSIVTGGSYSVRSIPVMGGVFMLAGVAALFTPASWGNAYMALGFGGLHIVFGSWIWRKHGG